ncbi:hypothetical protein DASC09_032980 [Saccharomycopsis crataegensis]|uniref:Biogenesis of lysosome-related organelles complex 1 subunit CNL1 n=1 Tax=Saccharomycopsis crataegensis TaxID=43959 RepID=A0AAV5QM80_9ASCO|nr:hypothetical protein DASC09_032980 [Saccharomycopsis crataegensis]
MSFTVPGNTLGVTPPDIPHCVELEHLISVDKYLVDFEKAVDFERAIYPLRHDSSTQGVDFENQHQKIKSFRDELIFEFRLSRSPLLIGHARRIQEMNDTIGKLSESIDSIQQRMNYCCQNGPASSRDLT